MSWQIESNIAQTQANTTIPRSLSDMERIKFHKNVYLFFYQWTQNKNALNSIPHLVFSGVEGTGKYTLAKCWINALYNTSIENYSQIHTVNLEHSASSNVEVEYVSSSHHVELKPENCPPTYQHLLVQHFVKDQTSHSYGSINHLFSFQNKQKSETLGMNNQDHAIPHFKTIVFHRFHEWSFAAQQALRRIIETSSKNARFILLTSEISRILKPIRSRCQIVRFEHPSTAQIRDWVIQDWLIPKNNERGNNSTWVNFSSNPSEIEQKLDSVIEEQNGNLRSILLLVENWFQTCKDITQNRRNLDEFPTELFYYPKYHWSFIFNKWLTQLQVQQANANTNGGGIVELALVQISLSSANVWTSIIKDTGIHLEILWRAWELYCMKHYIECAGMDIARRRAQFLWKESQHLTAYLKQSESVLTISRCQLGLLRTLLCFNNA